MTVRRPCVLVFAGLDPSGGAGMAADIDAIGTVGGHALPVATVLTVQDNDHVHGIYPVAASLVRQQAQALIEKIPVAAVKIGIVGDRANAETIASLIGALQQQQPELPVILDPVLASGNGDALSNGDAVTQLSPLLEVATLITPNLHEAARLCDGERRAERQAELLMQRGCRNVLIKGGHGAPEEQVTNIWFSPAGNWSWQWPRLPGIFHGSGCTLASTIAALLALGQPMADALLAAQAYTHRTLESSYPIAEGQRIPQRHIPFAPRSLETH